MKCYICGGKADMTTTTDLPICHSCAEKKGFVVCTEIGKVIADEKFNCNYVCSDCYVKDEIRRQRK